MKKSLFMVIAMIVVLGVFVASMIPTATTSAQGNDPMSPACQPEVVLSDFERMFSDVQTFEDLVEAFSFGGFVVADCYEDWLNLMLELLMEEFGGGDIPFPPAGAMPDVDTPAEPTASSSLTARDAEAAITAAFSGDIDVANEYICEEEQIDADEGTGFPDDLVIEEVSCQRLGDVMNCTFSINSEAMGGDLQDELNFEIVDELLCTTLE